MVLDESVMKRLAFIKYMYKVAIEQSYKAEPLCSISILTFHDAIESFSRLSAEFLGIKLNSKMDFMEYWNKNNKLTQKESMRRLNKARVNLKHYGNMPSKLDLEGFRASATNFFEENTPIIFEIEFSSISLIDLVQCEDAKNNLKKAEQLLEEDKKGEALEKIAIAFEQVIDDYKDRVKSGYWESPFDMGRSIETFHVGDDLYGDFHTKVATSINTLQHIVRILCLGIDYRRYAKFQWIVPSVWKMNDGIYHIHRTSRDTTREDIERKLSMEDVQFCIDFVIESAITLQEFEFSMDI